ncbi:hypothetical protein Moror_1879 [Moniliophthora roreri MCA 2997]|uniref:Uncharacterized protein n=1 Tax=Moniliophthora roreri (strain MCA 2997) TaxID=1381753 RepID=V2X5G0_MONRO|nr:hypothetical protein Moror_1879 [Moniliophthora roreri MCA 2997]KAI3608492.1 hypothetical protein WG66_000937 [Moniliophthora roreri]
MRNVRHVQANISYVSSSDYNGSDTLDPPPPYRTTDNRQVFFIRSSHSGYGSVPGRAPSNAVAYASTSANVNARTPLILPKRSRSPSISMTYAYLLCGAMVVVFLICGIVAWACWDYGDSPQWIDVTPSPNCSSIGTREYTGVLSLMPEGYHPYTACSSIPVQIHHRTIMSPISCWSEPFQYEEQTVDNEGNPLMRNVTRTRTKARWLVDFNEPDCTPHWDSGQPSPDSSCYEYGSRIYSAFMTVPSGLDALETCRDTSAIIHGNILHADRCLEEFNSHGEPVVRAQFFITESRSCRTVTSTVRPDDQCYCTPRWDAVAPRQPNPFPDQYCHKYGVRGYSAFMTVSRIPSGLDALAVCRRTPAIIHGRFLPEPNQCSEEVSSHGEPVLRARFFVDDPSCRAVWSDITPDRQCLRYGVKRYSAFLEQVPIGFDGMELCQEESQTILGRRRKPDSCEKVALQDGSEKIIGRWMVDYNVPECHTSLTDIKELDCSENAKRRLEAQVVDIGESEDWYLMCTTTPLNWHGKTYLPTQCESRTIWFTNYKIALFDVLDPSCVQ